MSEEVKIIIREYVDSRDFEYKIHAWTSKACKEMLRDYWKPISIISSAFLCIIAILISFIFNHFNTTILTLQKTTQDLQQSIIRLEQTVDVIYSVNESEYKKK